LPAKVLICSAGARRLTVPQVEGSLDSPSSARHRWQLTVR
jgi:hypothetical protein